MTIKEQEDKLFSEWRIDRKGFVPDGVADEAAYRQSEKKILFLMKEVNDFKGDLRDFMREKGGRNATWDNLTRWTMGMRKLNNDIPWSELKAISENQRKEFILTVAAMNLKKSPGGTTTDKAMMKRIALEDKGYICRQFNLYDADIVICCGVDVSNTAHSCIKEIQGFKWKATSRGVPYHELGKPGKILISYSHPEARVSDNLLYYGLIDAIREIYQEKSSV